MYRLEKTLLINLEALVKLKTTALHFFLHKKKK